MPYLLWKNFLKYYFGLLGFRVDLDKLKGYQIAYTAEQLLEAQKDAFNAARVRYQITSCGNLGEVQFKHDTFTDYINTKKQ